MKRRQFLVSSGIAVGGLLATGSAILGRAAIKRSRLANALVTNASTHLVTREHLELTTITDQATEDMKLWFTGACLNSASFIDNICSEGFASRLDQFATQRERELCVENEFLSVISQSEIDQQMEKVAKKSGAALDRNWQECCDEIESDWNRTLDTRIDLSSDFQNRVDRLITVELQRAISRCTNLADRPSAISTTASIGKESLMIMPITRLPPPYNHLAIPAFALIAIHNFANYVIGLLYQDSNGAKRAISGQLASLGNHVAKEFKSELQTRIAELHLWRKDALRKTAEECACESISFI
jgi:hypothetical protein